MFIFKPVIPVLNRSYERVNIYGAKSDFIFEVADVICETFQAGLPVDWLLFKRCTWLQSRSSVRSHWTFECKNSIIASFFATLSTLRMTSFHPLDSHRIALVDSWLHPRVLQISSSWDSFIEYNVALLDGVMFDWGRPGQSARRGCLLGGWVINGLQ